MIETPIVQAYLACIICIRRHYKWLKPTLQRSLNEWAGIVLEDTISDWNQWFQNTTTTSYPCIRRHYKWLKLIDQLVFCNLFKRIRRHYKWLKLFPCFLLSMNRDFVLEDTISDWNGRRYALSPHPTAHVLEDTISDWNPRHPLQAFQIDTY